MSDSQTPNAKLTLIEANRHNWSRKMNDNLTILDALIASYFVVQNLQGIWQNSTAYTVGQSVVDSSSAAVYQCLIAHTSAGAPTTFGEDRAAHASYWGVYSSPARARGAWLPNTGYALNDFVVSGAQYAICVETHTSSSSFATDLAANKWSVLVDLSSVGSSVLPTPGGLADGTKFVVTNPTGTGYDIYSTTDVLSKLGATSIGTALLMAIDQAAARNVIGAAAAGSFQPLSSNLTTLSGAALGATGLSLLASATAALARTVLGLGTAAVLDTGTAASKIVQLDGSAKLPAVDGSQLMNLPSSPAYFSTGDIKMTWKTTADSGWIMHDDGSIGSASSGASNRANADTANLYAVIWTNFSDTLASVAGGRGANAAADFAANKKITLPKAMGYAMGVAGAGSGLTARTLGTVVGEETHALISGEMPAHTHGAGTLGVALPAPTGSDASQLTGMEHNQDSASPRTLTLSGSTGSSGSGTAHNNVQPTQWYNIMIKL